MRDSRRISAAALLLLHLLSLAPSALSAEDAPYYREAYAYATSDDEHHGLSLPPEKARIFAESVVQNSAHGTSLHRYVWAFSQFDLENPASFDTARKMAEKLAGESETFYQKFSEAFQFAYSADHMSLSVPEAVDFARKAAVVPAESFENYVSAYNMALGEPFYMPPVYAQRLANSAGNYPPEMKSRYSYAFSKIPENSEAGFQASLNLAEELSNQTESGFQRFAAALNSALARRIPFPQAIAAARQATPPAPAPRVPVNAISANALATVKPAAVGPKLVPMIEYKPETANSAAISPNSAEVPASVRAQSLPVPPIPPRQQAARPGAQANLNVAVPAAGLNCGQTQRPVARPAGLPVIGADIPGFAQSLQAVQLLNQRWAPRYEPKVSPVTRYSLQFASQAFNIPEKFLFCSYFVESRLNNNEVSTGNAVGISQITGPAYDEIREIIQTNPARPRVPMYGELKKRWNIYWKYQENLGNREPTEGRSHHVLARDLPWSVAAGAVFTESYARQMFNTTSGRLNIDQLTILAGAYNFGSSLKSYCTSGSYSGCVAETAALCRNGYSHACETTSHMRKIYSCLNR